MPDFEDGKSHVLVDDLHGVHAIYYLYRTLKVPDNRRTDLTVGADGLFKVWVNEQLALEQSSKREPADGPAKFSAMLNQRQHTSLVKALTEQVTAHVTFN